jgi:2-polyprenyl-6-methoxyphenol hydroxylase-like FAD-dependent oxidoreductase
LNGQVLVAESDVLIVGAGPTGLALALWLTRQGVNVQVLDKAEGPGASSRAIAVQARTLELYRQLDLTDAVLAGGTPAGAINFWVAGRRRAQVQIGAIGEGLTPHPYVLTYPQDAHERLLAERLEALGVQVRWRTELLELTDHGTHISGRARGPQGEDIGYQAAYVAGCDGAHSIVRRAAGIDFHGGTYRKLFYVADIEGGGPALNGEAHVALDEADLIVVLPLPGQAHARARLVGIVSQRQDLPEQTPSFADVSQKAIAAMKIQVDRVNWFSTYRVHHRVAAHFRRGRAFLCGDAGHIHSPVGGQGMNTGLGDAINLAWKLAAVLHRQAGEALLDTYEPERIGFARRLVRTTDRIFTIATADGRIADFVRTRIMPVVFPTATGLPEVPHMLFRMVSQTMLNYRHGALAEGRAGSVHGGDRLPWAGLGAADNFASLTALTWQAHIYGSPTDALTGWCRSHGLPLHVFPWQECHHKAGLARDALYLLRPDTYVALADASGSPQALERYFATRDIRPGGPGDAA